MRRILLLATVTASFPLAALAQDCTEIRFQPGTSGAVVEGIAPAEGQQCFSLSVGAGQQAHVGIVSGDPGIGVTVSGVADNRRSLDFLTEAGRYELYVHQTFRAVKSEPFSMQVQVR